jgi:hypothetical protein
MKVKYVLVETAGLQVTEDPAAIIEALRPILGARAAIVVGYDGAEFFFYDERFDVAWQRELEAEEDAEEVLIAFARYLKREWLLHFYDGEKGVFACTGDPPSLAPLVKVSSATVEAVEVYKYMGRVDLRQLGELVDPCEERLKEIVKEVLDEAIEYARGIVEEILRSEKLSDRVAADLSEVAGTLETAARWLREVLGGKAA